MNKKDSTVILICHTRLVEYYLANGLIILEHNSNNLSSVPNKSKQIIHVVNIHESEFFMACYTSTNSVENALNKLYIQSDLNSGYIHNLFHDKQKIIDEFFLIY